MFCHTDWLAKMYMSHMLFASGLNGSSSLSNINLAAFTGDMVHAGDLQTQVFLDRSEHMDTSPGWDVDGLDVIFSQQSADLVCGHCWYDNMAKLVSSTCCSYSSCLG
ncbi:hypothetical protein L798_05667 [Zootermopsis nevadensis]|uniref:Uncharacterized protein n=1 Tax=Zootermopsis nevadensis TaxID=136037 RepID=A0A067R9C9_ZOONE|nr:hypothetical protein L798_05667 [Zootermopsis nevadensis]